MVRVQCGPPTPTTVKNGPNLKPTRPTSLQKPAPEAKKTDNQEEVQDIVVSDQVKVESLTKEELIQRLGNLNRENQELLAILEENNNFLIWHIGELKKEGKEKDGSSKKEKDKSKESKDKDGNKKKDVGSAKKVEPPKENTKEDSGEMIKQKKQEVETILQLNQKLVELETETKKKTEECEEATKMKEALDREVETLKADNETLTASNESLMNEKWDLQKRLQQAAAMSMMQGENDTILKEELHKLQLALKEERKVTEKLSRNLELEKRRAESLEQRAKSLNRRSETSSLPDEMRLRDELLATSMEKFRWQCEQLGQSLEECEEKLASFEIQEEYHAADLRKELTLIKKLLLDEERKSDTETQKFGDAQSLFGKALKDYYCAVETLKQVQQKKMREIQEQNSLEAKHQNAADVDGVSAKLVKAETQLMDERVKVQMLQGRVQQMEADIEAIPILKAQVEVYQADFNAERAAREKIAGEKADLEEEIRKIQQRQNQLNTDLGALHNRSGNENPTPIGLSSVRNRVNQLDEATYPGGNSDAKVVGDFRCPSCDTQFAELDRLQVHVNGCLDKS